jgi:hypothetical protein
MIDGDVSSRRGGQGLLEAVGLEAGLVDNKSCAIDGNWSAVRFVYRSKDRPA